MIDLIYIPHMLQPRGRNAYIKTVQLTTQYPHIIMPHQRLLLTGLAFVLIALLPNPSPCSALLPGGGANKRPPLRTVALILEATRRDRNDRLRRCADDILASTDSLTGAIKEAVRSRLRSDDAVPDSIVDRTILHATRQFINYGWQTIDTCNVDLEDNIDDSEARIDRRLAGSRRAGEARRVEKQIHTVVWDWKLRVERLILHRIAVGERLVNDLVRNVLAASHDGRGEQGVEKLLEQELARLRQLVRSTLGDAFDILADSDVRIRELAKVLVEIDRETNGVRER